MGNPKYTLTEEELTLIEEIRGEKIDRTSRSRYRLAPHEEEALLIHREKAKTTSVKRLFFDIETSPCVGYFWRPGRKVSISYDNILEPWRVICVSYKWQHEDKVKNLYWDKNQNDKELLEKFLAVANQADELVAHNGDRFDIKMLRTRCAFHKVKMRPKYRTLDTLSKSRGGFSFPSNRLNDIGLYLGIGQKLDTGGFSLWKEVMKDNEEALDKMLDYCDMDVVLLQDIFEYLQPYILNNTHVGILDGGEKYHCPNCGGEHPELLKISTTARGTVRRLVECTDCNYNYEISNRDYMNYLKSKMVN